jgi:hypothetical protein
MSPLEGQSARRPAYGTVFAFVFCRSVAMALLCVDRRSHTPFEGLSVLIVPILLLCLSEAREVNAIQNHWFHSRFIEGRLLDLSGEMLLRWEISRA